MPVTLPPSPVPHLRALEITPDHEALLQRFFEANPEYYWISNGEPPGPTEARDEIANDPPADMGFTKKWLIGWADATGELVAMANVITDLLAPNVWHIGYFVVATSQYGSGLARTLYDSLEHWALDNGANWMRLGIIMGNTRAERFWFSLGYLETRKRDGVVYGKLTHSLRVCCKPLRGGTVADYLNLVPRDRPGE